MSIRKVTADTVISPGEFINKKTIFTDGICGRAVKVTRVSGTRVYYVSTKDDKDEDYCPKASVAYASSTQLEADHLNHLSRGQIEDVMVATKDIKAKYRQLIDALIGSEVKA